MFVCLHKKKNISEKFIFYGIVYMLKKKSDGLIIKTTKKYPYY